MKLLPTIAFAAFGFASLPATAATVLTDFTDADFVTVCSDGAFNEACEVAVAEIRAGNASSGGDHEITVRQPDPNVQGGFGGNNAQRSLISGEGLALSIQYSATNRTLDLSLGGISPATLNDVDFGTVDSLLIRNSSRGGGSLTLTDLTLNGQSIGAITDPGLSYLVVSGFNFATDFTLDGVATFTFGQGDKLRSNLATQFKFVDIELSPVPLPAPVLLLIAALGGLALVRRKS